MKGGGGIFGPSHWPQLADSCVLPGGTMLETMLEWLKLQCMECMRGYCNWRWQCQVIQGSWLHKVPPHSVYVFGIQAPATPSYCTA